MTRTLRAGARTAVALSLALALTGCLGPAPERTPTPDIASPRPTATAIPTPDPVDPLTTVTSVVVRPESMELRDQADVVVAELDYLSPSADAVATLTTVFGGPPVDEAHGGSNHFPPSTAHRWDGLELWEQRYVDRWEGVVSELTLHRPAFMVRFTAASARGIALTTVEGRHAGESWDELLAVPDLKQNPSQCSGPYLDYIEEEEATGGRPYLLKVSVEFRPTPDSSTVESIQAPVPVYEDGCA